MMICHYMLISAKTVNDHIFTNGIGPQQDPS